jgi:hypothetical protein
MTKRRGGFRRPVALAMTPGESGNCPHDSLWFLGLPGAIHTRNLIKDGRVVIHAGAGNAPLAVHGTVTQTAPVSQSSRLAAG